MGETTILSVSLHGGQSTPKLAITQPFTAVYSLYSVLIVTFFLVMSPYLAWQAVRHRKYIGSLGQRLGYLPISFNLDGEESIWIHAVSVGEVLTARALLPQLKERYPRLRLFLSTTTMTGQQIARGGLPHVDGVFYFPFDLVFIVNRTLRLVKPRMFIMMETEIWPNLLLACHRTGVKTVLVNGRISSRSYPRYRLGRPFFRRVLAHIDRFCMQSEESARRIIEMGADPDKVVVTGSLKFDSLDLPGAATAADRGRNRVLRYFRVSGTRPVIIAASTMKGEEEAVFEAFQRIRARVPEALLIIAPRKPERFAEVEQQARRAGWKTARRSELPVDAEPRQDVVVLDTIGELAPLYQVATAVFVGGSLVDTGGHNVLEPAVFGKAIVFGPHMQNFAEIARAFVENDAALQIRNARELEHALLGLLNDPVRRARLGAAARALVEANRGARGKTMTAIARVLPPQDSGNVRPFRVVH
jgi:3-deoxy-D-manno-octulosonic-acid transferase